MAPNLVFNMAPNMATETTLYVAPIGYTISQFSVFVLGPTYKCIFDPRIENILEFNTYGYGFDPTLELVCIASVDAAFCGLRRHLSCISI